MQQRTHSPGSEPRLPEELHQWIRSGNTLAHPLCREKPVSGLSPRTSSRIIRQSGQRTHMQTDQRPCSNETNWHRVTQSMITEQDLKIMPLYYSLPMQRE